MPIRETVRSGRRENFYVTDNGFIDYYAREMQPADIAVYHALERYANCHTRSTWVGTAKIAEVLNVSQRTVQRSLKVLEELKLIRIVQTSTLKVYYIVPVPARGKSAATPLFDGIDEGESMSGDDADVAWVTPVSHFPPSASRVPSLVSHLATTASRPHDTGDTAYKEEQDLLNKTQEQELFNKTREESENEIFQAAQRIVKIMRLPESALTAATSAVKERLSKTKLSMDGIVQDIVTAANHSERKGIRRHEFLNEFLAEQSARQILKDLSLPITNSLIFTVKESVKAEAGYTRLSLQDVAVSITESAIEDRRRGTAIDRFYFEGVKWRSNAKISKSEQRKLDNLEVNARVKQRIRERLGVS
jgi:hypothetical protein